MAEITIGSPRIVGQMKNLTATADGDKVVPFDTVAPPNGVITIAFREWNRRRDRDEGCRPSAIGSNRGRGDGVS